jgi:hypothetical protein
MISSGVSLYSSQNPQVSSLLRRVDSKGNNSPASAALTSDILRELFVNEREIGAKDLADLSVIAAVARRKRMGLDRRERETKSS